MPAGGIASTANDMAKWMNMLLSGGLNEAGEEVSLLTSSVKRSLQLMLTPRELLVSPRVSSLLLISL